MERSESIAALAAALAKAQGSIEAAKKDSENPHFKSKYADLASVWAACREALSVNNVAVVQAPGECADGRVWLTTILMHSSGEWLSEPLSIPLAKVDAHGFGSALTYARRYALAAMVGVAPDDDDGNAAASAGTVDNMARKAKSPPFPQGPCANITSLKTAGREFWRDVEACEDPDQLDALLGSHSALVRQLREALPDWWDGGMRSSGEAYEGLGEVITRVQTTLEANAFTNPLAAG